LAAFQELIPLSARRDWEAALEEIPHAFAHTWESCRAFARTTAAPTYLYVWRRGSGRVVCPVSERSSHGYTDVFTPYGFSGFTGVGDWSGMPEDWREFATRRGYVCGYLAVNPLLADSRAYDEGDVFEYNDLYVLDLRRTVDSLFTSLSENRRRQIRASIRAPARLETDPGRCGDFLRDRLSDFYKEKGAGEVYRFSEATLEALLDADGSVLVGVSRDAEMLAVCHFVSTPHIAEYFAGVSKPEGRAYSAVLLWNGAMELKRRGVPLLNLGGGVTRGDGIADFKERFGGSKMPLASLKQIYRPDVYRDLCGRAGADPFDLSGYFPAFHRPRSRFAPGHSAF